MYEFEKEGVTVIDEIKIQKTTHNYNTISGITA